MGDPHAAPAEVLVIGGGFGGLHAAAGLARAPVRVTLVDQRNHHLFQPLLYQVATASLSPAEITQPIRHILRRQKNARVLLAEAVAVDVERRIVRLREGEELGYDYLVLACGASRHNYFGNDEVWGPLAPGLKSLEDAVTIRGRFLSAFEAAERETDPARRRALLNFVIVGAGPTGVELAGAMAEIARHSLPPEFRRIDSREARIVLLEAGPRVLPAYSEPLAGYAQRKLMDKLGVEVRLSTRVTSIEPGLVRIGDEVIETASVFWAAGIRAAPIGATLGAELDRGGRVVVDGELAVPEHPEVMVIGDLCAAVDATGRAVPGLAPAALQMGRYVARRIRARLAGRRPSRPFRYLDKGQLAVIGRGTAIADWGRLQLKGFLAWLVWLVVHIYFLIGFRNRLLVLLEWAWSFVGFHRGARLITAYEESAPDR